MSGEPVRSMPQPGYGEYRMISPEGMQVKIDQAVFNAIREFADKGGPRRGSVTISFQDHGVVGVKSERYHK